MGLQIQTNVAALNAQRNLSVTGLKMGKVLEKLSSGYRINRAADDAAGLGISEKMRAQIRGNAQAVRNAQDGISMLQTAEGAMDEVHSILQRMRELSVQAANGTYAENGAERTSIGQEINQLKQEIDRIATKTVFNGQHLLTGNLSMAIDGTATAVAGADLGGFATISGVSIAGADPGTTYSISYADGGLATDGVVTLTNDATAATEDITVGQTLTGGTTLNFSTLGVSITLTGDTAVEADTDTMFNALAGLDVVTAAANDSAQLQVGANAGDQLSITFTNMQTTEIGAASNLAALITDDQNVSSIAKASTLISEIDGAIEDVNSQRGELGAVQNRLESVVKSLSVTVENLSAAESRIRDADVASLSSELVSNQILQQAGISVLSQANTAPQAALSLLQT
jgi:flagellin